MVHFHTSASTPRLTSELYFGLACLLLFSLIHFATAITPTTIGRDACPATAVALINARFRSKPAHCLPTPMTKLTDEQKETFVRDGFVVLPGFARPNLVDAAERRIDRAYENGRYREMTKKLLGRDQPTPNFNKGVKQSNQVMNLMYKAGLFEIAEDLLGEGHAVIRDDLAQIAVTLPCQHFIDEGMDIKEPQPRNKWHIDAGQGKYAAQGTDFSFLMGVALSEGQEVDENRGQFNVWPGTFQISPPRSGFILAKIITNGRLFAINITLFRLPSSHSPSPGRSIPKRTPH